ncbi:MAG TPA: carboxypeptidase-like regulatory domain-containing protein, partial [Planctomycetota bacterium]|nr:carboxypeptidase-like regulatory domain-containing protein [Planctomycetota bacterium]
MMEREEAGATSDARGRFTLSLPAAASSLSYRIDTPPGSSLRLAGFRSTVDDLLGIAEATGAVRMDVEMKVGDQTLAGTVSDGDGKPVKDAVVTITWGEGASPTGRGASQSLEATTDAKGVYRFEHLLPGSLRIDSVVAPRGSGLVPLPRTWRGQGGVRVPSKEATEKDFRLVAGASIRGRVIDENGKAVAGAKVSAGLAPATIEGPAVYLRSGNFSDATATDDRGRYTLEGLTPETYQVTAASPDDADFAPGAPVTGLRCETGKTLDAGDIVLVKGGVLEGRVTGADGKPVAAATVYYGSRKTATDVQGKYRFDHLPTGVDSLRVFPPEGSVWAAHTLEMVPCLSKVSLR